MEYQTFLNHPQIWHRLAIIPMSDSAETKRRGFAYDHWHQPSLKWAGRITQLTGLSSACDGKHGSSSQRSTG